MMRAWFTIALTLFGSASAFAVVVAPVPRLTEWKVPGVIAEEPAPPGEMEDPAKILERVTQNAKAVGDRLKDQDTGDETRKKQDQVLKDIDALLKQSENSPPPPMESGGSGEMPPMPPMDSGGGGSGKPMPMPMGSNSGGAGKPRPMRGGSGKPEDKPMGTGMKEPMMQPGGSEPKANGTKEPMMKPGAGEPKGSGTTDGKGGPTAPNLPNEDPFTKQVWGHLPEKLRQQASQYYREQYMPKYQEMLKQYYLNLAERSAPAARK